MKKIFTVLILFNLLTNLWSASLVRADNLTAPAIQKAYFDKQFVTRGEKVRLVVVPTEPAKPFSTAVIEMTYPSGISHSIDLQLNGEEYFQEFDYTDFWSYPEFGTHTLDRITLFDRYGNQIAQQNLLNENISFTVTEDNEAPIIKTVNLLSDSVFTSGGDILNVQVEVEEDGTPETYATLYLKHLQTGKTKPIELNWQPSVGLYEGYDMNWYNETVGEWQVDRIDVKDVAFNHQTRFGPFEGDTNVNVLSITDDILPPQFISSSMTDQTNGYQYEVIAKDNSFLSEVIVELKHRTTGRIKTFYKESLDFHQSMMPSGSEEKIQFSIPLDESFQKLNGFWDVHQIELIDQNQNKTRVTDMSGSFYVERIVTDLGVKVIKDNTTLGGTYVNQDIFVMKGALLSTFPYTTFAKNVYMMGALKSYGGLTVYGTIYGNRMLYGHTLPIYNGDIQLAGTNNISNMNISNSLNFSLPVNTGGALVENSDGTFDINGITLPLSNRLYINGIETVLEASGQFKARNVPMNQKNTALISVRSENGTEYKKELQVYSNEVPVVSSNLESGIYLTGTKLELTATKDSRIYYDPYEGVFGEAFMYYEHAMDLTNDMSIRYYAEDSLGIASKIESKSYRVFSVYPPKASETFLRGNGGPGMEIKADIDGKTYSTKVDAEGRYLIDNLNLSAVKKIQVFSTDGKYTSKSYEFDVINDLPIVIKGAEHQKTYNRDITITYNKGTLFNKWGEYIPSATTFTQEGNYELYAHDEYGNHAYLNFIIDKTAPIIERVHSGLSYSGTVSPTFNEGTATLNGVPYISGTEIEKEDDYELIVSDQVGNQSIVYFTIDRTLPVIIGIEDGGIYSKAVTIDFDEGMASLNGHSIQKGDVITESGLYTLVVEDRSGNQTIYSFEIDTEPPYITGVQEGQTYKETIIYFSDGNATLNGKEISNNYVVNSEGIYELIVTDRIGNESTVKFKIDRTAPLVTGIENQGVYSESVVINFNEGLAWLNSKPILSGSTVSEAGTYQLDVEDYAGNKSIYSFEIDKEAPQVNGVQDGKTYREANIRFSEGTAKLNDKIISNNYNVNIEGKYKLDVTDKAGNISTVRFEIDRTPPILIGVENQKIYSREVTLEFDEGIATLNGEEILNGTVVRENRTHLLIIQDQFGNEAVYNFEIDTLPPVATGVSEGKAYREATIQFSEGMATLNGKPISTNHFVQEEGLYSLILTDTIGNQETTRFAIDRTLPTIVGVENGKRYSKPVKPVFNEGTATLNGEPFMSGSTVEREGDYELSVKDAAGNTSVLTFVLDLTAPIVTGVKDKTLYNKPVIIMFDGGNAFLNGVMIARDYTVSKDGNYELIVRDLAGNETFIQFEVDQTAPNIVGVESKPYNKDVTPTFESGMTATLNEKPFMSGTRISTEGSYKLIVTDIAKNSTQIDFSIDKSPVSVTGVEHDRIYRTNVTPIFNEGTAVLNGQRFESNTTVVKDGNYELIVVDLAGNETIISFEIDQQSPIVSGVTNKIYNHAVTPSFSEGIAVLNGQSIQSGTTVSKEGTYELIVTDKAGNETTIQFIIDVTNVTVTGVKDGEVYKQAQPIFSEGTATVNDIPFKSGTLIDQDGSYRLLVVDHALNKTELRFTIDTLAPQITGLIPGKANYREVTLSFNEGEAELNGKPFVSGTKVLQEGDYEFSVKDEVGHVTKQLFVIDRTAPIVTGITSKEVTNRSVTISFNEGDATINGKVISSGQSITMSGTYSLRVTDAAGNIKLLTFTIDKTAPTKPTVSTLTNKSTYVSGKAEKGATVYITYNGRTYTTKASSAGSYRYNVKTTKPGVTVSVRARDAAGNTSSTASVKVLNTFRTFTVNSLKSTSNVVIGKGNKGATIKAYVGTKLISKTAKVDSKGNYKLTISRQKPGVVVTVKMTQSGYQEVKKTIRVVK